MVDVSLDSVGILCDLGHSSDSTFSQADYLCCVGCQPTVCQKPSLEDHLFLMVSHELIHVSIHALEIRIFFLDPDVIRHHDTLKKTFLFCRSVSLFIFLFLISSFMPICLGIVSTFVSDGTEGFA